MPYPGEDRTFSVVEVDVACLATNLEAPYGVIWPDGAPRLEGVIVCYDASNEASFRCVRGLLSKRTCCLTLLCLMFAPHRWLCSDEAANRGDCMQN